MTALPVDWFEVLDVDPEDVARVGHSLAEYALEYETPDPTQFEEGVVERELMLATTLADAATLLVLIDQGVASEILARGARLYERAGAPEAWTLGLASNGFWQPSRDERDGSMAPPPSEPISSLAALYYDQEVELGNLHTPWRAAGALRDNAGLGWSLAGVPASMFEQFVAYARGSRVEAMAGALDRIVERADEPIRFAQELDRWRWQRFLADVPLIDLELVALGHVASRVDGGLIEQVRNRDLSPARVALLVGMRLSEAPPPRDHLG
ncbi:hypothetical protein ASC77_14200 [Nocardioides sp. Root1257]|uniref:hypothetical protein n=1 Tax=unclassified Nocardioides TaxID=2615069 RepID=UPI0006F96A9C|nr:MULTISPECIES: hypothetical protein [unclassified Nocardioides]KQW47593.1 hypothetical protein ASC77_14200 [Nocardioides sp. Root1257]KRC45749.1 hypothetical protein ASE24_14205 [Nocardioides sp. Root224]